MQDKVSNKKFEEMKEEPKSEDGWDLQSGKLIKTLKGHGEMKSVAISRQWRVMNSMKFELNITIIINLI